MSELNINDVLNDTVESVQSFKKAEDEQRELRELKELKNSLGRPKKSADEKAKRRVIYYTDDEFSKIEKVAKLYSMSATQFIKFCVAKEIKKELDWYTILSFY